MTFNYSFDENYKEQKILNVDFGPVNIIEPKYYIYQAVMTQFGPNYQNIPSF